MVGGYSVTCNIIGKLFFVGVGDGDIFFAKHYAVALYNGDFRHLYDKRAMHANKLVAW